MIVVGRIVGILLVVWLALSVLAPDASAQRPDPRTFEVEWKRRTDPSLRPGIEGWVSNPSNYRVGSVLLRVQTLDGANQVVSERRAWVYGHIPAGGRGQFIIFMPPDDRGTYRIVVDSFDLISQENP